MGPRQLPSTTVIASSLPADYSGMWARVGFPVGIALLIAAVVLLVVVNDTTAAFWCAVVGAGVTIRAIGDYVDRAGTTTAKALRLRYEGIVIGLFGVAMIGAGIAAIAGLFTPREGVQLT